MARDDDEDTRWTRQLLVGLAALVAVALMIGAVVSVVALGAARVTGLDASPEPTRRPSLFIPTEAPTTTPEAFPDPDGTDGPASGSPRPSPSATPTKRTRPLTLRAFPRRVSPNERINLTGVYRGGGGARLQVQRFEGGWTDFPVSTSVDGRRFSTYIFSGREGVNRFRVVDKGTGRASNPVRVRIR